MKKLKVLLLLLLVGLVLPVKAADYEMKELIPVDTTTTVHGEIFIYKGFNYSNGIIKMESIRNNSFEKHSLSISIGLFGEDKKNIGIINYCEKDTVIISKETYKKELLIDVKGSYLAPDKTIKDVKYISVIGENTNCRTDGSQEFIGSTVEQIGMAKNTQINSSAEMLINILKVIGVVLVGLFIYKFLFTSAYRNMDGEDVRQEYAYINKELRKDRERELKRNPPKPKEIKRNKTDEQLAQEQKENAAEKKDNSDLHNLYK